MSAALQNLTRDTMNAHAAFAAPGPDPYSVAQGASHPEPGGVAAQAADYLTLGSDFFLAAPDPLSRPIAAAAAPGLAELPLPSDESTTTIGEELRPLLDGGEQIPLSLAVALLLNSLAVRVDPTTVSGPFLSPYARLSFAGKARVFELMEEPSPALVSAITEHAAPAMKAAVAGQVTYLAGVLLQIAALGSYIDWLSFDRTTRTFSAPPAGWRVAGFQPDGPVEGWDDFQGYYQNRRKAES